MGAGHSKEEQARLKAAIQKLPKTDLCKTPQPVPFLQLYHALSPVVEGSTGTREGDDTPDNSKH